MSTSFQTPVQSHGNQISYNINGDDRTNNINHHERTLELEISSHLIKLANMQLPMLIEPVVEKPGAYRKRRTLLKKVTKSKEESRCCDECKTKETSEWRRGPKGRHSLCNACGLRWSRKAKQEENELRRLKESQEKMRIPMLLNEASFNFPTTYSTSLPNTTAMVN